jgi:sec-independent protein translocase protein TatC
VISPVLFFLGVAFAYFYIIPAAWRFFMSFENQSSLSSIVLMPKISEYLDLSIKFMIAFGVSFQIPVVLTLLSKAGIIDHNTLIRGRRVAIVIIFILAAILTPPDVVSQFGLAFPMILLYELSILACKCDKKRLP